MLGGGGGGVGVGVELAKLFSVEGDEALGDIAREPAERVYEGESDAND